MPTQLVWAWPAEICGLCFGTMCAPGAACPAVLLCPSMALFLFLRTGRPGTGPFFGEFAFFHRNALTENTDLSP